MTNLTKVLVILSVLMNVCVAQKGNIRMEPLITMKMIEERDFDSPDPFSENGELEYRDLEHFNALIEMFSNRKDEEGKQLLEFVTRQRKVFLINLEESVIKNWKIYGELPTSYPYKTKDLKDLWAKSPWKYQPLKKFDGTIVQWDEVLMVTKEGIYVLENGAYQLLPLVKFSKDIQHFLKFNGVQQNDLKMPTYLDE